MARIYPVDPGERDRLVTIQTITQTKDADSGEPTETPATLTTAWMKKSALSGREQLQQGQMSAAADTRFEMGYRPDMDPDLVDVASVRRLVYQGRIYDIVSAAQIGRCDGIELITVAKVG
jgi:SPP1 family predicted phage head-tail adaptor